MRPNVALRGARRLLHHFAQLAGQSHAAAVGQQRCLDVKDLAAGFGPCQTGGHAGGKLPARLLARKAPRPKPIDHVIGTDGDGLRMTFGMAHRNFARDPADGAFELAHAGLARVLRDDRLQRLFGDDAILGFESGFLELTWNQIALGDFNFLFFAVAGQAQ